MKRNSGQPTKLTDEVQERVCELARDGLPQQVICDLVGINRSTLTHWLRWGDSEWQPQEGVYSPKNRSRYLRFFTAFHESRSHPIILCERVWLDAVRAGDAKAAERWLAKHHPTMHGAGTQAPAYEKHSVQILAVLERYNDAFANVTNATHDSKGR